MADLDCVCRTDPGWWAKATHNLTQADLEWAEAAALRRKSASPVDVRTLRVGARAQVGVCAILGWPTVPQGWAIKATMGMQTLHVAAPRPDTRYILATVDMAAKVVTLWGWAEGVALQATPFMAPGQLHRFPLEHQEPGVGASAIFRHHAAKGVDGLRA